MSIRPTLLTLLLMVGICCWSQTPSGTNSNRLPSMQLPLPIDITVSISGQYAEFRGSHFHSGVDLRTDSTIGIPVHAVADGYVSRINIRPWGGGKIIYIDHPAITLGLSPTQTKDNNGASTTVLRTVCMHLDHFDGAIARWIDSVQYASNRFAFDTNLPPNLLPVKAGQVVAYSGNSGSSGGPHLHYETRYAYNDQTINPQLFGVYDHDSVAPTIHSLLLFDTNGIATNISDSTTNYANGTFYLGLYSTDKTDTYNGKNGLACTELYADGHLIYRHSLATFRFEDSKYIATLLHYNDNHPYLLSRTVPGVPFVGSETFDLHNKAIDVDGGFITLLDKQEHTFRYVVTDFNRNRADTTFTIRNNDSIAPQPRRVKSWHNGFVSGANSDFVNIEIPASSTYACSEINMHYDTLKRTVTLSQTSPYHLGNRLQRGFTLRMRAPHGNTGKMLIVQNRGNALTTKAEGTWLVAHPSSLGTFRIETDNEAPVIKKVGKCRKKNKIVPQKTAAGKALMLTISDNLSGIDTYHCMLNGKWILADYDGKSATLTIMLPESTANKGSHNPSRPQLNKSGNTLQVTVKDRCGNTTTKQYYF